MILDFNKIKKAKVNKKPFTFFTVENVLADNKKEQLEKDFPNITGSGIYNINDFILKQSMQDLINDLSSDKFRSMIGEKLKIDLTKKKLLFTLRGFITKNDGIIHPDSTDKLVTILLYFNKSWTTHKLPNTFPYKDSGCLRILNSATDINDYAAQVPPLLGNMVAFKVTENSYHGHLSHDCIRKSLQFNYWN